VPPGFAEKVVRFQVNRKGDAAMSSKPVLLFYCQHSLGMGHLVRSLALAEAFAVDFRVVFLNGGDLPAGLGARNGIEILQLPALGMDIDGRLLSRDERYTLEEAKLVRRQSVLGALTRLEPKVIVIELFPFGRKKFAFELLPLLKGARQGKLVSPIILCSLRDILVSKGEKQQRHDDRACGLANRYFDGVLVHSDPKFARLEESFQPRTPLRAPVHYTGFVLPERSANSEAHRARRVLISAGSGRYGARLFQAALAAHDEVWKQERLPSTLVAGPFLPEADWRELGRTTRDISGIQVQRSVPDMGVEMLLVRASVSQCGYNTAMDILYSGVPALVVPFSEGREDEQIRRARRLEQLGVLRVLESDRLDGPTLAKEVCELLNFEPNLTRLDLNGTKRTANLVRDLLAERSKGNGVSIHPSKVRR
jgi:predicted glycosyltransferase